MLNCTYTASLCLVIHNPKSKRAFKASV